MIKIEETEVHGWETAIRGMRNPMNSWDKSDSFIQPVKSVMVDSNVELTQNAYCKIGKNDLDLMKKLINSGTDHSKFMRMITVTCDILAPLYWWKEFDTYKVGTVRNSCSTMHKIHEKEFTLDDFSHEHLAESFTDSLGTICKAETETVLKMLVNCLNFMRERYLYTKDKRYWWQMIQLLPSSYNQRATVQLNYQVLRNIYQARKNHKLAEWRDLCRWIENLPYSDLITGGNENE